jgi:hypothetical protein
MTAICGFRDPAGTVWIGADTRVVSGSFIVPMECRKILRAGVWRIGQAGSGAAGSALQAADNMLARCADVDALAREIRRVFRNAEFSDCKDKNHPGPPEYGQEIIVATPNGRLTGLSSSRSAVSSRSAARKRSAMARRRC